MWNYACGSVTWRLNSVEGLDPSLGYELRLRERDAHIKAIQTGLIDGGLHAHLI